MVPVLLPSTDVHQADWYTERLAGFGGRVNQVLPDGFPAYARILHPPDAPDMPRVRWSQVAAACGTTLHPTAQFLALARRWTSRPDERACWQGQEPFCGNIELPELRALVEILARHTTTPQRCWLTFWVGGARSPSEWETAPRVYQPSREYYLFPCLLEHVIDFSIEMDRIAWNEAPPGASAGATSVKEGPDTPRTHSDAHTRLRSPDQWWPHDRAWCVATAVDFDSTLVGGSAALIDDILDRPDLEALPIRATDDLSAFGDHVNGAPSWS